MQPFSIALLGDFRPDYVPHHRAVAVLEQWQETWPFSFAWIPTAQLEVGAGTVLSKFSGFWAGSGPYRSKTGILNGIQFARETNRPFLGTCSGFGYAVLEFARSQFGLATVHHPDEGLNLPADQQFLDKLAACGLAMHPIEFTVAENTVAHAVYGSVGPFREQSHCSYGLHPAQEAALARRGVVVSGRDAAGEPTIIELATHPLFMAMLFYPQLNSTADRLHPMLDRFLTKAAETARPHEPVA